MRNSVPHSTALPLDAIPVGTDQHFETEQRTMWDDETQSYQVHEFVYEVSWVPELGVWRRFLRTHRKA